jgi:hypothetical protein
MSGTSDEIRLQILLRADARNPSGLEEVQAVLRALHFDVTGVGRATVSARATPEAFRAAFGSTPAAMRATDAGEPARDLPIPSVLAERVESVTIAPQHLPIGPAPRVPGSRSKRGDT